MFCLYSCLRALWYCIIWVYFCMVWIAEPIVPLAIRQRFRLHLNSSLSVEQTMGLRASSLVILGFLTSLLKCLLFFLDWSHLQSILHHPKIAWWSNNWFCSLSCEEFFIISYYLRFSFYFQGTSLPKFVPLVTFCSALAFLTLTICTCWRKYSLAMVGGWW